MSARIAWTPSQFGGGQVGRAGGIRLFYVGYGVTRQTDRYYLKTELPVASPLLGQKYRDEEAAQEAAERLLASFIRRISEATE